MPGYGLISGNVTIEGSGVSRKVVALSYDPQLIEGVTARIVVGETESAVDGTFSMQLQGWDKPVIVVALDDYGEVWQPNTAYSLGDKIRPTPSNETGYVYQCTAAGTSGASEPTWWVADGGGDNGAVGTATFQAIEAWWPLAHAPITPIWFPDGGAEFTWQAAGVVNGDFETGDLAGWTVIQGTVTVSAALNYVYEGLYAARGDGGGQAAIEQSITIPANARAFRLSAACIYGGSNQEDQGGVKLEILHGSRNRLRGTNLGASGDASRAQYHETIYALIPAGATQCKLGAWFGVESGTNNGGVDNIELDFLVGTALPSLSAAGLINGDFETGDLTGWSVDQGGFDVVTSPALYIVAGIYGARSAAHGSSTMRQSFPIPVGATHAVLTGFLTKNFADTDRSQLALRFRDSLGAVISVSRVYSPRVVSMNRPADLIAQIPDLCTSVDVVVLAERRSGTNLDAGADEINLHFLDAPVAFTQALAQP